MKTENPRGDSRSARESHSTETGAAAVLPRTPDMVLTPDRPPVTPDRPTVPAGTAREARLGSPRGFAMMDPSLVREIARKGGKAAHSAGTAHEFTSDEARIAGRKGGLATHEKRRRNLAR